MILRELIRTTPYSIQQIVISSEASRSNLIVDWNAVNIWNELPVKDFVF